MKFIPHCVNICVNPLQDDKILDLSKLKQIADHSAYEILKLVPYRVEKENLLITSIVCFSHNVFHSFIFSVRQNAALCGNGLTLSQTTISRLIQTGRINLQTTISNLTKMADSSPNWWKTLWEKEKLLLMSNFSFSHSVFKRHILAPSTKF